MTSAHEARLRVAELLARGLFGDPALRSAADVLEPIEVRDPDGVLNSWFCPVTIGDRLAGFAQLLPDLTLMRYSSFERRPGDTTGLPDAASWIDPDAIRSRAAAAARPDEELGDPVLSYDTDPARIAWRVPAIDARGRSRTLFVAGDYVYEARRPDVEEIGG